MLRPFIRAVWKLLPPFRPSRKYLSLRTYNCEKGGQWVNGILRSFGPLELLARLTGPFHNVWLDSCGSWPTGTSEIQAVVFQISHPAAFHNTFLEVLSQKAFVPKSHPEHKEKELPRKLGKIVSQNGVSLRANRSHTGSRRRQAQVFLFLSLPGSSPSPLLPTPHLWHQTFSHCNTTSIDCAAASATSGICNLQPRETA